MIFINKFLYIKKESNKHTTRIRLSLYVYVINFPFKQVLTIRSILFLKNHKICKQEGDL